MPATKEFTYEVERGFLPGHRACAGCGQAAAVRLVMDVAGTEVVVANATGCLEVFSTPHPESAWGVPWVHSLFENVSAVASGLEAALKHKGKLEGTRVLAFGGDGATLDIGFGSLSGMLERGHDVAYFCMDNEAYMNTGVQRSGSTPFGASTTTSPAGRKSFGEDRPKKDLPAIVAAHGVPYVATASMSIFADLRRKTKKALGVRGPKYVQVHVPCPPGWGYDEKITVDMGKLAVDCGLYPLVEWENGEVVRVRKIKPIPVEEYLKPQRRFRHLFRSEAGKAHIAKIQEMADANIKKYGLAD
ncbi:MAG TPA: thiamine pyrophosphate-dependent enzyme [Armatimonadota bacterium]|nr:thiamine pyrophosphate-dependent enzyme [Armatimonadota bacterium]